MSVLSIFGNIRVSTYDPSLPSSHSTYFPCTSQTSFNAYSIRLQDRAEQPTFPAANICALPRPLSSFATNCNHLLVAGCLEFIVVCLFCFPCSTLNSLLEGKTVHGLDLVHKLYSLCHSLTGMQLHPVHKHMKVLIDFSALKPT